MRNGKVIFEGEVSSLHHEKDDMREVRQGFECGVGVREYDEFQARERLEFFVVETA